ncbi:MAG: T9SS type A sorting domain-containing protein [Bacteroidales bacterium]|nr:T9SS type A sorting domain-containing protein [Bacteroidales bacterium]
MHIETDDHVVVTLINSLGEVVRIKTADGPITLDTANLPGGLYNVSIARGNRFTIFRVIIQQKFVN